MSELQPHSRSESSLDMDQNMLTSELFPQKQALHQTFMTTLEKVLPHLGKDESKIVSALIILALKLDGVIGKELSKKDSKLIEVLKEYIMNDDEKKDSAMKIANRFNRSMGTAPPTSE